MGELRQEVARKSVLERVFALLDCFTAEEPELTLAELAARTGIPKPTVHRLTGMMVDQRLMKRTATGFALGIRLFELGELVDCRRTILDASLPVLEELFEQTHETIHLGIIDGGEVLYFVKIVGYRSFPLPTRAGSRWPVHACALGKVMMAFGTPDRVQDLLHSQLKVLTPYTITDPGRLSQQLARARREGVAYENEEAVLGNACVAAPIFNSAALPTAAVSVAGPPLRLRAEQRAPLVRRAAASITSRIGGRLPDGWRLASAPVISEQQIALLSGSRPRACPARRTRR